MRRNEYIEMLLAENTEGAKQSLYADVIDCLDIALSQEADDFEVDSSVGLADLFKLIETEAKEKKANCIGPFEAAELFAKRFGAKYERLSRRASLPSSSGILNLEDFI